VLIEGVPDDDDGFIAFDNWTAALLRTALDTRAEEAGLPQTVLQQRTLRPAG
jgi:hypothetical protein